MHTHFRASVTHSSSPIKATIRSKPPPSSLRSSLPVFKSKYTVAPRSPLRKQPESKKTLLALGKDGQAPTTEYLELLKLDLPSSSQTQYHTQSLNGKYALSYDREWLAITRAYNEHLHLTDPMTLVAPSRETSPPISAATFAQHKAWVQENITSRGKLEIPNNFVAHAPVYSPNDEGSGQQPNEYPNQQTAEFAELLEMENKFAVPTADEGEGEEGIEAGSDHWVEFGWD